MTFDQETIVVNAPGDVGRSLPASLCIRLANASCTLAGTYLVMAELDQFRIRDEADFGRSPSTDSPNSRSSEIEVCYQWAIRALSIHTDGGKAKKDETLLDILHSVIVNYNSVETCFSGSALANSRGPRANKE